MAVGNTFGATSLSSYGGFWIAYGLLLTPTWNVLGEDGPYAGDTGSVMGFFLTGWFIFTTLLLICTLRSTVAFFLLFFTLDICFLLLACENYAHDLGNESARLALQKAAGFFGFLAAFMAWYNALAGIQDSRFVSPLAPAAMPARKEKNPHGTHPLTYYLIATPSSRSLSSTFPGLTRAKSSESRRPSVTWHKSRDGIVLSRDVQRLLLSRLMTRNQQ